MSRSQFINDQYLHSVCRPVARNESIGEILIKMDMTLAGAGVGLAANQIGFDKRIIMIKTKDFKQVFINPEIKGFGGRVTSREGCLSFPGKTAVIARWAKVEIAGFDTDWQPLKFRLKGLNAIVAQHEVDHLDGKTCMDQATKIYE